MDAQKPFAPSAERNKQPILDVLQHELTDEDLVFEFGSGTGQHICHFARHFPKVRWQPSDVTSKLDGIQQWIAEADCANILAPLELDLGDPQPTALRASVCYSANTLHIISWPLVVRLFMQSATMLPEGGKLCVYGPFSFSGKHISQSNEQFDLQLRGNDPSSGIRDLTDLDTLAREHQFSAARVVQMPANNHLLIWNRRSA